MRGSGSKGDKSRSSFDVRRAWFPWFDVRGSSLRRSPFEVRGSARLQSMRRTTNHEPRTTNDERRTPNAEPERRTTNRERRTTVMRIAWFSPLPPIRSGIATYTPEIVPRLASAHAIDLFDEGTAHDFVWKARRTP